MESNHSSLREVLNSIASIQHELVNDQTQMMDSALLGKIKLLAAQLYMEVDIELLSREFPELEFPELDATGVEAVESLIDAAPLVVELAPKVETVFEPVVESPVVESPVVEEVPVVVVPPVVEVPVVEGVVPAVVEAPVVVEAAPVVEEVPVVVVPTVVEVPVVEVPVVVEVPAVVEAPPVIEMPTPAEPKLEAAIENTSSFTVNGVIGQMPLSRRFEFSNILFGGDMEKMGLFIQQMIDAPNASARLDVYDHWYEEKQWRRRDESASDMLRMLKRIFAS
jgi:hypothetical protein